MYGFKQVMNQQPFDPLQYGYYKEEGENILPVTTTVQQHPVSQV